MKKPTVVREQLKLKALGAVSTRMPVSENGYGDIYDYRMYKLLVKSWMCMINSSSMASTSPAYLPHDVVISCQAWHGMARRLSCKITGLQEFFQAMHTRTRLPIKWKNMESCLRTKAFMIDCSFVRFQSG